MQIHSVPKPTFKMFFSLNAIDAEKASRDKNLKNLFIVKLSTHTNI